MDLDFFYNVYAIVCEIPCGKVASYAQIAKLAGREKNSRLVGKALRYADQFGDYPCHRVLHQSGVLVEGWDEQKDLLLQEGIQFKKNGTVDMSQYQWKR